MEFGMTPKWEKRFLELATTVGQWSKQEKKVGAVVVHTETRHVLGVGYNGPPPDFDDSLLTEENSTDIVVHAEVNAIRNSSAVGDNLSVFVCLHPCAKCATILASEGRVKRIVCPPPITTGRWAKSQLEAINIFNEAGIEVSYVC
jgi:dCMP deaminase